MILRLVFALPLALLLSPAQFAKAADEPDLILHHGKIATADDDFSICEAMSVKDGKLLLLGANAKLLQTRGPKTEMMDLQGRFVVPGLIDSHVHPVAACMTEFDHPIPTMESISDVLDYLRGRVAASQEGDWIVLSQVFITRLKEQRYPTKTELDEVAPRNPVVYSTGPDASINSLALKLSGIDKKIRPLVSQPAFCAARCATLRFPPSRRPRPPNNVSSG
jgi:predicted amidohydrolase YtcJ